MPARDVNYYTYTANWSQFTLIRIETTISSGLRLMAIKLDITLS